MDLIFNFQNNAVVVHNPETHKFRKMLLIRGVVIKQLMLLQKKYACTIRYANDLQYYSCLS